MKQLRSSNGFVTMSHLLAAQRVYLQSDFDPYKVMSHGTLSRLSRHFQIFGNPPRALSIDS